MKVIWLILVSVVLASVGLSGEESKKLSPGQYDRIFKHGERERSYILHLPEAVKKNEPLPLVLL